jgi:GT2 family glycosyltransferase
MRRFTSGEMTELSIIIVNWNTKEYLVRCLRSVFETEKQDSWEVFVIDNGSGDGSGEEVKKAFPFVHLIQNEKNLGFAQAVNQGLKNSSGRYILLLNPDTRVKSGAIDRLVAFLDAQPDAGIAGAQLLNTDGSKQNSMANFPSLATELLNKSLLRLLFPKKFPGKRRHNFKPVEVDSVIGACMMVRRDVVEQVGFLDQDYFLFLEETDWCYRIKKAGWKIYHVPQAEVYHYQGKSAGADKKRARVEYFRSRYHFFKKNRGDGLCFVLVIGVVIRLLVETISMSIVCLFTVGMAKSWRRKLSIYSYLLWWHLRLFPERMGLKAVK